MSGTKGLGAAASRGAVVTMGGQGLRIIVQLGGIVILGRLLGPSEYGVIAMVTAIIGVGEIFRDFGLSSAAIQAKTVSRGQKSNLFWINLGIGAFLTALTIACSGLIGAIYDDPRLQPLAIVLSSTFLLNGFSTQFRAELNRNLKFARLALAEIVGQALGLAVGITMAVMGYGYWALAGQQVSQVVIQIIVLLIVTRWFPGRIDRSAPMGQFLKFGANLLGVQLLSYASRNVDSIIIGARFGPTQLGLYNRAFQLMLLPLNQINAPSTRVALPVLSRLQDEPKRFGEFVSFGQTVMMNIVTFILAYSGAQAYAVIRVAIGDKWLDSVPIFQILLVAGFFQTAGYAIYWIFLAKGLTRSNLYYSLLTRPLMVVLIIIGSNFGVFGVAIAYAASIAMFWPVGLWWISRVSDAPARLLFTNGLRTIIVYGFATGVSYFSTLYLSEDALVLRLVVGFVALVAALGFCALVWPRFRKDIKSILGARRLLKSAKNKPKPKGEPGTNGPPPTEPDGVNPA